MNIKKLAKNVKKQLEDIPTPFILFNLNIIKNKIALLKKELNPDKIFYAVKCNSIPQVLQTIRKEGCGFEVNNAAELARVEKINGKEFVNSSPITSANDVREMRKKGINIFCIDSKAQVDNLAINAPKCEVFMRIYSTNEGSKFALSQRLGIHSDEALSLLKYAKQKGLKPIGITFHVGSQCSSPFNWKVALIETEKLFRKFPSLKIVNLGGGFPVSYNGSIPDIREIANTIKDSLRMFDKKPQVWIEPGRALVGDSAFTCASVTQVDHKKPMSRLIVDASIFTGMIEILEIKNGFRYPIQAENSGKMRLYQIGGPTCAGTDIIVKEVMLPEQKVDFKNPKNNSRLYFVHTGAYTMDYIAYKEDSGFNGAKIPKVYFLDNGQVTR